jgi:peptide/nickel transport system permease protein
MTRIIPPSDAPPPPRTRLGLVVPGLGHLLVGEWAPGAGLLGQGMVLAWAAVAGVPRLTEVIWPEGRLAWHGLVACVGWFGIAAITWWTAWRRAYPRTLSPAERNTNAQIALRAFRSHRTGMLGLCGAALLVTLTVLTPLLAPFDPLAIDVGPAKLPPGGPHLLGTDDFGRDLLSRLLYGGRISLTIGFVAVSIAATIGTSVGAIAGYFGGLIDRALMWVVDLLLALPHLVLLITIVGLFRLQGSANLFLMVVVLGFTSWMGVARMVRSQVLSLKQQEFVLAARALGLTDARIVARHVVPNALAPVIVYCSLAIGSTMLAEASLSFLGLGVPPPTPTWGVMVNEGREPLRSAPWIATFPGLAIVFSVMSFNLLGDGLRDALDPRLRRG